MNMQSYVERDIVIENAVWLGLNSAVIVRVIMGDGQVIEAGSMVSIIIPESAVAGGVPARPIKTSKKDGSS